MNASQKVTQYLQEAKASEEALVRVLQSQIAMTPSGSYRSALETHLEQTRTHARRVRRRIDEIEGARNPLRIVVGLAEEVVGQPLDLLRGTGGEEKVLKNAKDAAATEALEIATYAAIERLAQLVGDDVTVGLAQSIRADEEMMLARIMREIPALTDAVVRAQLTDDPSYDVTRTGAADALRKAGSHDDPAISGYDDLTAAQITAKLPDLSRVDLAKVVAYEQAHKNRAGVRKAAERRLARS
jgi:ferritin-like metal-binding protein YciE